MMDLPAFSRAAILALALVKVDANNHYDEADFRSLWMKLREPMRRQACDDHATYGRAFFYTSVAGEIRA